MHVSADETGARGGWGGVGAARGVWGGAGAQELLAGPPALFQRLQWAASSVVDRTTAHVRPLVGLLAALATTRTRFFRSRPWPTRRQRRPPAHLPAAAVRALPWRNL